MNGLRCAMITLATVTSMLLPALQASARPVEPDFPCYMRMATGRIVDLTAKMCSGSRLTQSATPVATTSTATTSQDSAFMKEYKHRVSLEANRGVIKMLIQEATESPGSVNNKGSEVCRDWSGKVSEERIKTKTEVGLPTDQEDALKHAAGMAQVQLFIDLAKQGFCPNSSGYNSADGNGEDGNCTYASDIAADGSRCGKRASTERAGGQ